MGIFLNSIKDAPARLKKELDSVLLLQGEIEVIDEKILQVQQAIGSSSPSDQSLSLLTSLQTHQSQLKNTAEELYASLNVQDSFPELTGINLEFVRTLLLARDLKINIRKRAIGSFFEWDRLDQAVGGRDQAIGTFTLSLACFKLKPVIYRNQTAPVH